jgi:hypothetical protein
MSGVKGTGANLNKSTLKILETKKINAIFIDSFKILFIREGLAVTSFIEQVYRSQNENQTSLYQRV